MSSVPDLLVGELPLLGLGRAVLRHQDHRVVVPAHHTRDFRSDTSQRLPGSRTETLGPLEYQNSWPLFGSQVAGLSGRLPRPPTCP